MMRDLISAGNMEKVLIFTIVIIFFCQTNQVSAGCSGSQDLPVQIGTPNTRTYYGRNTYLAPDVHSLANQLMLDIPALTLAYANVVAEDALHIEENFEITYRFFIASGQAKLSQFKVTSTTLGDKKVNVQWDIIDAYVTYSAHRNVKIQRNRRRRRWIGGGRRRCTWKKVTRGVTKYDIQKIQNTIHSTMNKVGSKSTIFVQERRINMKSKSSRGTCAAWSRVIKLSITRGCIKRSSPVPKEFVRVKKPVDRKPPWIRRPSFIRRSFAFG